MQQSQYRTDHNGHWKTGIFRYQEDIVGDVYRDHQTRAIIEYDSADVLPPAKTVNIDLVLMFAHRAGLNYPAYQVM